jgi:hypothetical protein
MHSSENASLASKGIMNYHSLVKLTEEIAATHATATGSTRSNILAMMGLSFHEGRNTLGLRSALPQATVRGPMRTIALTIVRVAGTIQDEKLETSSWPVS